MKVKQAKMCISWGVFWKDCRSQKWVHGTPLNYPFTLRRVYWRLPISVVGLSAVTTAEVHPHKWSCPHENHRMRKTSIKRSDLE